MKKDQQRRDREETQEKIRDAIHGMLYLGLWWYTGERSTAVEGECMEDVDH